MGLHTYLAGSPDLDIEIHLPKKYLDREAIIPIGNIRCHCARISANLDGSPVWLTIGLERVRLNTYMRDTAV